MNVVSARHKAFGQRIKEIRSDRGMTQEELASKLDVDRSYVGFLERGEQNASLTVLFKIAKALRVDSADLLKGV